MKYFADEFDGYVDYYSFEDSESTVVLLCTDKKINKDEIIDKLNEVIAKIKKTCDVSVSVGVSEINKGDISYRRLYRHARRCLEYRTVVGSNIVLFFDDLEAHNSTIKAIGKVDENEYKAISYDILYGKKEDAKNKIHNLVNTISTKEYSESYYFILNNLLDTILEILY
jgi:hypothetical protein